MPRAIYDRPTRELLKEMLAEWGVRPGQVFTTEDVLTWFAERYPKLQLSSVKAYLVQASTNDGSRLHRPSTHARDDLLVKVAAGQYRLYVPKVDPPPLHHL
jgi:endonuclease